MKTSHWFLFSFLPLSCFLQISSCSVKKDLAVIEKVKDRSTIDSAFEKWERHPARSYERLEAIDYLASCSKDADRSDESRAYCFSALNQISLESSEALPEMEGILLPNNIIKLSQIMTEARQKQSRTR